LELPPAPAPALLWGTGSGTVSRRRTLEQKPSRRFFGWRDNHRSRRPMVHVGRNGRARTQGGCCLRSFSVCRARVRDFRRQGWAPAGRLSAQSAKHPDRRLTSGRGLRHCRLHRPFVFYRSNVPIALPGAPCPPRGCTILPCSPLSPSKEWRSDLRALPSL